MLIEWMAYATLLTALICCAALAVERAVAIWRGGQRFVWLGALVAAIIAPALLSVRRIAAAPAGVATASSSVSTEPRAILLDKSSIVRRPSVSEVAQRSLVTLDPYLRDAWLVASFVLLAIFTRATIGLHRQRSRWHRIDLAGERLLLAPDAGPAVVGILHPQVVVPQWALSLDATARELMLRHEAEHIRARDPHLLFVAALSLVLFPWNAGLWFVVRRLRLAIEVDCDQRVLRGSVQPREYGMLLLTVGARHSASLPLAVSLAERRPFLERRIRAMTTPRPRNPRIVSLFLTLAAVVVATAAWAAPRPAPFQMRAATPEPRQAPRSADAAPTRPITPVVAPHEASADAVGLAKTSQDVSEIPARTVKGAPADVAPPREPGVPIELIRAILKMHHPNVLIGDSTANLVTIVLDHDLNYVSSSTESANEKMSNDDGRKREMDMAYRKSFLMRDEQSLSNAVRDTAVVLERADKLKIALERKGEADCKNGVEPGPCEIIAYKKMQMDSFKADISANSDAGQYERAIVEKKLMAEAAQRAGKLNFINPEKIDAIEVRKFPAGSLGLNDLGVIVIVLKAPGGA